MVVDTNHEITDRNSAIPIRVDGYYVHRIPCCTHLNDANDKPVLALNPSSRLIWENCSGELTVQELIDLVHTVFDDVPYEKLEKDIVDVIEKFLSFNVIECQYSQS
ncbi:MAG: PqqD family protein [Gammaproteobacteria bacterium]|nr:PqqD family protein [Gammaproteobacteria bacterium]